MRSGCLAARVVVLALVGCSRFASAGDDVVDSAPLPLATGTVPASTDECAVWHRERSFAHSVEAHDIAAFASHVAAGAVFDAGAADATRGRDAIVAGWKSILEETSLVLRWRPGIVDIGGDPSVALSRGPYILQLRRLGQAPSVSVGLYQTVWRRDADGVWRVLFDGNASALRPVADRAAADAWVRQQPMSDCASP